VAGAKGGPSQSPPPIIQDEEFLMEVMELRDSIEQLSDRLGCCSSEGNGASTPLQLLDSLAEVELIVTQLDRKIHEVAEKVEIALSTENGEPVDFFAAYQLTGKWKYLVNARSAAAELIEKYKK
jgi:hypothetical protein